MKVNIEKMMMDSGFIVMPECFELTNNCNIGQVKNKLHTLGYFMRISNKNVYVCPKLNLNEDDLDVLLPWAQDQGYTITMIGESYVVKHGSRYMFLYIEETVVRGKLTRQIMAEYLNRHENVSDCIIAWHFFKGLQKKEPKIMKNSIVVLLQQMAFNLQEFIMS
jgi:hypothetical protein